MVLFVCFLKIDLLCQQQSEKGIFYLLTGQIYFSAAFKDKNPTGTPPHLYYQSRVSGATIAGWKNSKAEKVGNQIASIVMEVFPQKC